jgi:hypothetical protein
MSLAVHVIAWGTAVAVILGCLLLLLMFLLKLADTGKRVRQWHGERELERRVAAQEGRHAAQDRYQERVMMP